MARIGSIDVLLRVSYGEYERSMLRASGLTEREGRRMQGAVQRSTNSVNALSRSMSGLRGREFRVLSLSALRAANSVDRLRGVLLSTSALFGGFGAVFTLKGITDYSDAYKNVANRLRIVKGEAQSLADLEQKIFETAQKSRAQYEATGVLYARIANSARRLQISSKDVLRVTETIQKAFLVGGATPQEAAQSSVQLSQGIASNRLQGDELRSVLENPALGQLLADRITQGNIGRLRELAAEGELTAGVVIRAFKDASGEIDRLFATTEQTIGQAFVRLDNALIRYIGTSDKVNASSRATVTVINALADNIETVGDVLVGLGIAAASIVGGRVVRSFMAASAAAKAMRVETLAAANAEMLAAKGAISGARAKMIKDRLELNKAYREGALTAKQVARIEERAAKSTTAYRSAVTGASRATASYNSILRSQGILARGTAASMRVLGGAMNFLGGPVGVALLALGGAFFLLQKEAQAATERAARYSDIIEEAGRKSSISSEGIREAADALASVADNSTYASLSVKLEQATKDMLAFGKALDLQASSGASADQFSLINTLDKLGEKLKSGAILLEDYIGRTDELAKMFPGSEARIDGLQQEAVNYAAAREEIRLLHKQINDLDGTVAEAEVKLVLTQDVKDTLASGLRKQTEEMLKGIVEQGGSVTDLQGRMYGDILDGVKSKRGKKSDAEKAIEKLDAALAKLEFRAASFDFSKVDQETIEIARSAGVAEEKIRAFIASLDTGGAVPEELAQIKARLQEIAGLEFSRAMRELGEESTLASFSELDQEVVKLARDFGVAEDEVRSFMAAIGGQGGGLSQQIAMIRDTLKSNEISQSFADFKNGYIDAVESSLTDLHDMFWDTEKSARDFALNAAKSFSKLAWQLLIVEPLMRSIRASLSGTYMPAPTPMSAPTGTGFYASLFHSGGDVGTGKQITMSSSALSKGVAKFHSGMKNDEYMALLQKGERVATAAQTAYEAGVVRELTKAAGGGGGGGTVVNVYNNSQSGVTEKRRVSGGTEYVDIIIGEVGKGISGGKMDGALGGRYGVKPQPRDIG